MEVARPGDFFLVRPELKSSTVFLPGWWTHGALFLGGEQGLISLGAAPLPPVGRVLDVMGRTRDAEPLTVIEALSAGVVLNPLTRTLQVDHAMLLRPNLATEDLRAAVADACIHYGKPYDFEFDFSRSDRLVCTEVIYRAFHGKGDLWFTPSTRLGRPTLSADDIAKHVMRGYETATRPIIEVIAMSRRDMKSKTSDYLTGDDALGALRDTLNG